MTRLHRSHPAPFPGRATWRRGREGAQVHHDVTGAHASTDAQLRHPHMVDARTMSAPGHASPCVFRSPGSGGRRGACFGMRQAPPTRRHLARRPRRSARLRISRHPGRALNLAGDAAIAVLVVEATDAPLATSRVHIVKPRRGKYLTQS